MSAKPLQPAELTGRVASIVWRADDRTAVIARLDNGTVIKGQTDPDAGLAPHLTYRFAGEWHEHEKYGRQFHFVTYGKVVPADRKGVIAYLVSTVDGVGEKTALRLWEAFGPDAVTTLRERPAEVASAGVMSREAAEAASRQLHDEGAFEAVKIALLGLFQARGFQHQKLIRACIREWGERAPELIRRNPYLLLIRKLPSAGFKRCDKMYLDLGGRPERLKRQMLCAWHTLRSDGSGHTWMRESFVADAVEKAIPLGKARPEKAVELGVRSGWLARKDGGERYIAERSKAKNEETIGRELLRLSRGG